MVATARRRTGHGDTMTTELNWWLIPLAIGLYLLVQLWRGKL